MKKLISIFLFLIISFSAVAPVFAANDGIIDSGNCGLTENDNVKWTFYKSGTLVISGEGETDFYETNTQHPKRQPWYDYFDRIWCVTVEEGITGIGANAFAVEAQRANNIPLCRVDLPLSLKIISTSAVNSYNNSKYCKYLCYSGNEEDWRRVFFNDTQLYYNDRDGKWYVESQPMSYYHIINDNWTEMFNGEKPEPFCEINRPITHTPTKEETKISLKCYTGEYFDGNFQWNADKEITISGTIADSSGKNSAIAFSADKTGKYTISVDFLSSEGKVICSDSVVIHTLDENSFGKQVFDSFMDFLGDSGIGLHLVYGMLNTIIAVSVIFYPLNWILNLL
ncbi:MAG: hypothetical protein IJK60_10100 [Clostridia bacterium]|nr:hypothetical protein [Clostridia bacterium]